MSKSSLFILFLAGISVVIVAEILVYQYLEIPYKLDFKTSLFGLPTQEVLKYPQKSTNDAIRQKGLMDTSTQQKTATAILSSKNSSAQVLTTIIAQQVAFKNLSLKKPDFNGLLFEQIDVKEIMSLPVSREEVASEKGANVASFYLFEAKSHELAKEVYGLLKKKCSQFDGGFINETNSFGENSFYFNQPKKSESVFLVVKKGGNVYALTYEKSLHTVMQKVIQVLP